MPKERLLSLINQLEAELKNADSIEQDLVEKVTQDLEKLKTWEPESDEHDSDIMLEAAVHFEEKHPKAATIINDIAHLLSNIGI